ncbi:Protein of unknown function [Lachnospiraceae bacterium]|nr:Protein of unknown function [Lachnospiraceae bacterium]
MADYTAIYETGNAITEILRDALTPEPVSKREMISLCTPYEEDNNQLTVHLYHVEMDTQFDTPKYRTVGPTKMEMAPSIVNAYYLITAHSKAPVQLKEADTYRILGAAIQAIADMPTITDNYLNGSLVSDQSNIHLEIENNDFEKMMKIWNNTQTPYKASFVVKATGIAISSKRTKKISRVTDATLTLDQKAQASI